MTSTDVQFSAQYQLRNKGHQRPQAVVRVETSQNFRVTMISHVFSVQHAKKEDIIWGFHILFYLVAYLNSYHEKAINALYELA